MSASQILLAGHGQEDQWLSDNPNRTYFEAKYQPRVNRSRETYEIPFDNQVTFDSTGRCTIPVKGDYLTRLTLRAVMPPIYPTVPGQYVYPTPSSQVGGTVYVNMGLTAIVADGTTLTANTVGNHYFSIGAQVTLAGTAYVIFDLDGTYTITGIPTANSFTCSTVLAGISYNGTASSPGIQCGDIISYFSTTNSNLWVNNITNKTWQITNAVFNGPGTQLTLTTSEASRFPVGKLVHVIVNSLGINGDYTVLTTTDTSFTINKQDSNVFLSVGSGVIRSLDDGQTWSNPTSVENYTRLISAAYGNSTFIVGGYTSFKIGGGAYSIDNGQTWISYSINNTIGVWGLVFGNGIFIALCSNTNGLIARSTDNGVSWTTVVISSYQYGDKANGGLAFGNNTFIAVGSYNTSEIARSTDDGVSWNQVYIPTAQHMNKIAFGNNTFVAVGINTAYSSDNGVSWTVVTTGSYLTCIAFGHNIFIAGGSNILLYSINNGVSWLNLSPPYATFDMVDLIFGDDTFIAVTETDIWRSTNDGQTWTVTTPLNFNNGGLGFGTSDYSQILFDSVTLVNSPLQLTNRVFTSDVYPSISFANAADAAFWGFDSREGLTYSLPAPPPWTLTQSGWISGFLPPSTSTYDDSVAHKLCKDVRIMVGKQTIKEYSGEYIELHNDLTVSYENKAILKLMNGTLDQTQATVAREYYVNLPFGTKEVPLCALNHQHMSVEVDFDSYMNLSQNLNKGTGDFVDARSYTTYDASTGILGGEPINVQTTFSYQQYIFIVTYGGQFIIYDTTKDVSDPASYTVLLDFVGTSQIKQFCVLSGNLYVGLITGELARMIISELIQGNTSSFILNNYTPTNGSLTGTMVADFRYVYYTVSNTATSNVFMTRYDTTGSVFTDPVNYTTVDFTTTFNSSVNGVYQIISTGTELILIPQGVPGTLYTFQLNADIQRQWYQLYYFNYGGQITEGVLIGNSVYFVIDGFNILKYDSSFTSYQISTAFITVSYDSMQSYSSDGKTWYLSYSPGLGYFNDACYGNGIFMAAGGKSDTPIICISSDGGKTWSNSVNPPDFFIGLTFANGVFVGIGTDGIFYSENNGQSWTKSSSIITGTSSCVAYGNGTFVSLIDVYAYRSEDNGQTWTYNTDYVFSSSKVCFGNGVFVTGYEYSEDGGQTWNASTISVTVYPEGIAFGNGVFVITTISDIFYSEDNGQTWISSAPIVFTPIDPFLPNALWVSVTFQNGMFVAVSRYSYRFSGGYKAYSTDNGHTWTVSTNSVDDIYFRWSVITSRPSQTIIPGDGFKNLIAVGNYIYCSTSNVAVQIDTTQDLSTPAAYKFPAPVLPTGQYVLANGPRYVYMFAQGDNTATNIVEFDPYGPDTTFKASILVDYESLPPEVPKPDKALIGLVQTQKVTDMNYMNIKGPVKELWVTGMSDTANVFDYSNLAPRSSLEIAGEQIVTEDVGTHTFLNIIEPFETHTSMPIRNFSVVPFEFDPESDIPNGTVNFSRIRDQIFEGGAETVWARSYNLLAIQGGIGNLMYN